MIYQPLVIFDPKAVSTHNLQRSGIVIMKLPKQLPCGDVLCQLGPGETFILFVDSQIDIEILDKVTMEKFGWVRKDRG